MPTCSDKKNEDRCFWAAVCGYIAGVGTACLAVLYIALNLS